MRRDRLTYRASLPLASAPNIVVEGRDGSVRAHVQRGRIRGGRMVWRFTGEGIEPFAVEDDGELQSFLVTRTDGAPFGRIRVRGWLRVRLEAQDARAVRLVVQPDGRLCDRDGSEVGRIDLRAPNEVVVELEPATDPTHRSLMLAMPVCQAANAPLLLT